MLDKVGHLTGQSYHLELKMFSIIPLSSSSPAVPAHEISDPQRAGHLFFFSALFLEESPTHSRHSKNICCLNKWVTRQ